MSVNKELLKSGVAELYNRAKITPGMKTEIETYISNISETNIKDVKYAEFNQTDSLNITFNDAARTAVWDSGTAELLTNKIELSNIKLKALKLKGSDENVVWKISENGTTWYTVSGYNMEELITAGIYIKVECSQANTITGIIIIYENN